MREEQAPDITPLVKALTRAPTLFGVPYMYAMFNMVVTAVIFLATKGLLALFLIVPIHMFGYFLTLRDEQIFSVLRIRGAKTPPQSKSVWGVKSYAAGETR
ncbi:VirB3 family type IV secretion system protein [Phyllobacterium sp. 21LDTY02-6]|jgi:type IV secretion system protein VirB3|uniref:type IV secretion system protein VirB3 n=1 Tax=unclassified Phyllobacterium TaxID=2638441 RepID=UPI0020214584|nr:MULTISPECIES: VirB3 family type IV secretion system protein [unclassified Phyllobacterium]MCO4317970.1 VirB3 family type IV secretion system protein [Phyllobacterium sp. 21LDTY02-6]MCX8282151.1 VirB3 family type IV secretion system protein [Phyllobacterium sp. 0TCS1.6C]MCX8296359.1 VirB3 family type IV secretion system protein [Phyllobacterium sp. 0TCS1.6A]